MRGYLRARDRRKSRKAKDPCTVWQLVVEGARDDDGGRVQRFKTFHGTKEEAQRALRAFIGEVERGFGADTKDLTFAAYVQRWIEYRSTDGKLRATTLSKYAELLERHVIPVLGKRRLDDVTPSDIERLYDRVRKTGNKRTGGTLSGRSVLHLHRVLFAAMQRAVTWRLISSNPCVSEAPTAKRFTSRTLTAEEGRRLVEAAVGTRLHVPILLALGCGLRRGEVCAIKWAGIDFERATLHISESLQGDATFVPPKTDRSRRTIALPASVVAALRVHKARQNQLRLAAGESYSDLGLVFCDGLGRPWKPASIATLFRGIAKRAGIGHLRFHDLRHSAASLLIERGVPVTTVSEMLGHANSAITLSIYAHSVKGAEERAARTMDGLLKGVESGW